MKRQCIRIALIALVLAAAGCASKWDSINSSRRLNPDQGHVLVALSYTGTVGLQNIFINYRLKGSQNTQVTILEPIKLLGKPDAGIVVRNIPTNTLGELKLMSMPAGEYEFISWTVVVSSNMVGMTRVTQTLKPVQPPTPIAFNVTAGRITYIGNMDIQFAPFGKEFRMRVMDEQARDLELFRQRGTNNTNLPVDVKIMVTAPEGPAGQ